MYYNDKILIGKAGEQDIYIYPKMANRHGLIAGATGTGKTITLKVLAESFSDCGVPVFLADAKGDLAGMLYAGEMNDNLAKRIEKFSLAEKNFDFHAYPTNIWDIYGENGINLRTTVSDMGPLLLGRILGLNETQSDILTILFKIADDEEMLLIDIKDLKALIQYVGENTKEYTLKYSYMTKQSLGAIMRSLVALESEGGDLFFGEPALDINDWLKTDSNGRGYIQVLACEKLINNPTMYGTFLLWMMSELFENLPEAGDLDKPKLVFFFDEAHMLFNDAPKELKERIEQVVKLIRSKGVGIYFITQSPADIPDGVLGQLGNKIQHALRAYTPADQKKVKAAAQSFRANPLLDTEKCLLEMGTGEALVSVLDEKGIPTVVEQTKILPPQSRMGAISPEERKTAVTQNPLFKYYNAGVDRISAYEVLLERAEEAEIAQKELEEQKTKEKVEAQLEKQRLKEAEQEAKRLQKEEERRLREEEKMQVARQKAIQKSIDKIADAAIKSVTKEIGKSYGRKSNKKIKRGLLDTLLKNL